MNPLGFVAGQGRYVGHLIAAEFEGREPPRTFRDFNKGTGRSGSLCGEFTRFAGAFYKSAMNYTSLGSGDVVMSASWKLLGPLEAASGMLMFGVSTALIFAVIQRLTWEEQGRFES